MTGLSSIRAWIAYKLDVGHQDDIIPLTKDITRPTFTSPHIPGETITINETSLISGKSTGPEGYCSPEFNEFEAGYFGWKNRDQSENYSAGVRLREIYDGFVTGRVV
jgi:hypothetical protein